MNPVVTIFDVDGTLTPARQPMRADYRDGFARWMAGRIVYFITGSDIAKLRQQLDDAVLRAAAGYFTCAGAEHWVGSTLTKRRPHTFPPALYGFLDEVLSESSYPHRTGRHVEERTGMINFSIVGRNASNAERKAYFAWDSTAGERRAIVGRLAETFPAYDFSAGGEISIDIVPRGNDKSQIVPHLVSAHPHGTCVFYGNRMGPEGNDRTLAEALHRLGPQHRAVEVADDLETFLRLGVGTRLAASA